MHRKALGRGLEALIPAATVAPVSTSTAVEAAPAPAATIAPVGDVVQKLSIDLIGANPFQPRTRFDDESLREPLLVDVVPARHASIICRRRLGHITHRRMPGRETTLPPAAAGDSSRLRPWR